MRQIVRALSRRPAFAVVAIVTLALGFAASVATFCVVDAVLVRPLPYPGADRLAIVWEYSPEIHQKLGIDRLPASPADVFDFRAQNRSFGALAWMRGDRVNLTGVGEAERLGGIRVSADFFDVMAVPPIAGRIFDVADAAGGRAILIGEALWARRFGRDPAAIGRKVLLNGEPAVITGVLPGWFRFPRGGELPDGYGFTTTPEVWTLDLLTPAQQRTRGGKSLVMIGRLRDGVSLEQAREDLAGIAARIAHDFPEYNANSTVRVLPLREQLTGGVRVALLVLLAAVFCVLLISCANVANLLLVRANRRQKEMCIRRALGASRAHIMAAVLGESVLLAILSAVAGLVIGSWALHGLLSILPPTAPAIADALLHWRVIVVTSIVAIISGLLFGLGPALQVTGCDVVEGLKDATRGSTGGRRSRAIRHALVVGELALAIVLMVGAALLVQTFLRLMRIDPGFRSDGILTLELSLPTSAYTGQLSASFYSALVERIANLPGVDAAGATSSLPLAGRENLRQIAIAGAPPPPPGHEIVADYRVVTRDYFDVLGIARLEGEGFPEHADMHAVVISESLARTHWPGVTPLGREIKLAINDPQAPWYTVTGVVRDTRTTALDRVLRPQVYVHLEDDPAQAMWVVMRTKGDPLALAQPARGAVQNLDPNQPVSQIRTMNDVIAGSVSDRRFTMFLVGTFALIALTLAVVGIYAVVSYSVNERIREMGVRLALGARPASLLTLVLGEGLRLVAIGAAIGIGVALLMTRFLETLLYDVGARDPWTFVGVPLLLGLAALAGCAVPAVRAMRVDPVVALRVE